MLYSLPNEVCTITRALSNCSPLFNHAIESSDNCSIIDFFRYHKQFLFVLGIMV